MRYPRLLLGSVSCALAIGAVACGDSGKRTGLDNSPTPAAAIDRLPSETQAAFAAWKASPIKRCTLDDAFPGFDTNPSPFPNDTPRGIDAAALIAKNGGAPIVTDGSGKIGLITAVSDGDGAHSEMHRVTVDDGAPADLHAELSSGGRSCTVKLFGQVVFDSPVFTKVSIGAIVNPASSTTTTTDGTWHSGSTSDDGGALVEAPSLRAAVTTLAPTDATARALVGSAFGGAVSADDLAKIVRGEAAEAFAIKLDGAPELPWIDARTPILLGSRRALVAHATGAPIASRVFFEAASLASGPERYADVFAAELDLTLQATFPQIDGAPTAVTASARAARGGAFVRRGADLVATCAAGRVNGGRAVLGAKYIDMIRTFSATLNVRQAVWRAPQVAFVERACEPLGSDLASDLASTERGRATVASMIGSASYVALSWQPAYEGWDGVAGSVLDALLEQGTPVADLDAALNPGGASGLLTTGATYRAALRRGLAGATLDADGERALTKLAYAWALHPVAGYDAAGAMTDFQLREPELAAIAKKLAPLATSCPQRFIDAAKYLESDLSDSSQGWAVTCGA